jgi:MinD superfamily P-loop ATPase
VVETARGSDYLLLVTEPTPFGLHDLRLAVQVAAVLSIPAGVIINRENGFYPALEEYCADNGLTVLLRIPFERVIAEGVAKGKTLVEIHPDYVESFQKMYLQIANLL